MSTKWWGEGVCRLGEQDLGEGGGLGSCSDVEEGGEEAGKQDPGLVEGGRVKGGVL